MQDPFSTCMDPTPVVTLEETGSTNAEALRLAASGESGPIWVTARRQTAGRGRHGRNWASVDGNLHASLLLTLWAETQELPQLSLLAGVALAEAVAELRSSNGDTTVRPVLKWPNDLLFKEAKCAGILVETTAQANGAFTCVLGFGANIVSAPDVPGRSVTCLADQNIHANPGDLIGGLDRALRNGLRTLSQSEGLLQLKQRWMLHALPIGTPVTVSTGAHVHSGSFAGLDDDGALLLQDETGRLRRITHGDVSADGTVV